MSEPTPPAIPNWRLKGDWFDLCSCNIGCPCVFGANPSTGTCEGVLTWIIREGNYGDVPLGGFNAIIISAWTGGVLERNRHFGFLIDARADPRQRDALERIFTGQVGGHFAAWRDLTVEQMGVKFVPIHVTFSDETWKVEVPGMIDGEGGPYRNLMVPDGKVCKISNAPRPEVGPGDITVGQAKTNRFDGFGRKWDWSSLSAKHIPFEHIGPGKFSWRRPWDRQTQS
jgi:hypothetical protein